MKVKAIKDYNDLQLKRLIKVKDEEILTVSEARGKHLIELGLVVKVEEEEKTEPTPKKKTTKKKDVE
jgi:hypothetical protein